jgi:ferric-dicitrate binding protein FerR (iron transport regulator)
MRKYEVETALFTSWRSGRLVFKNMSLEDLMRNITRWYDVEVKFERESLKKVVFTGDMKKYEDLSDVLEFIELTSETHFLIEGNKIIVY